MEYKTYTAPPVLQPYVRYFWSCESFNPTMPPIRIKSFADRFPRLVYQDLKDFAPMKNDEGSAVPFCYICGVDTLPTETTMEGQFSHFGASFYPHAMHLFFGIDACELVDQIAEMQLFSKKGIHLKLNDARSHHERVKLLSAYLYEKLCVTRREESLIRMMIECNALTSATELSSVHKIYKISERQLERKFKTAVGVSPKKLQRIIRFEESLIHLSGASYKQLGAVSYALNYADQSHFIKDFRSFSGMSPLEFMKKNNLGGDSSSFIYTGD